MASNSSHMSAGNAEQGSVAGLLTRLMDDAVALAKNEIALAKAEARGALNDVKKSIAPFAIAGGVLLAGALTLVAALVLALAEVMQPWLAALIVGVVLLLFGWMLLKAVQRNLANIGSRLDRTQNSLQKDATVVARRT
jgi:uncharacterized membrane protein